MKYEAIRAHSQEFSVGRMCKVLGLAQSAYYQWKKREERREEKRLVERGLIEFMRSIFDENRRVYGYRRMYRALMAKQTEMQEKTEATPDWLMAPITEYRVRRLMQQNGMFPETMMKYKPYKKAKGGGSFFENVLNQEFAPERPNEVWAGDITYIKTVLGFVYLAVVVDLFNREIIGYSVSKNIDVELVKRALCNALVTTEGGGKNTIFHSDRGIQYSSKSYQQLLADNHMTGSMSKPGCPYDNAPVESFFSVAKRECIYRKEYVTMDEIKSDLFEYIELFYNRKRMHGSLGYKSPVEYRLERAA